MDDIKFVITEHMFLLNGCRTKPLADTNNLEDAVRIYKEEKEKRKNTVNVTVELRVMVGADEYFQYEVLV